RIGAKTLVLEMGADHQGDLAWLIGIARPDVAVITAVAPAHAEYIGTIDEISREKATLVRSLPKSGLAVLNADDPRVTAMHKEAEADATYVGESEGSDVRLRDVTVSTETDEYGHVMPRGIEVVLEVGAAAPPNAGQVVRFELQGTIGHPQAWAAGAAIAVARALDVLPEKAVERLKRDYHGIAGRTRIIPGIKFTALIDDTYNAASPTAVVSGLRDVASIPIEKPSQRRIAALGDMRELGAYSDDAHRTVGHEVAAQGFDMLVTCGTLARAIASAAREAGMPDGTVMSYDSTEEGGMALQSLLQSGDIVYVKGSQGSRMEKVVKELMAEPLQAPFLLVRMTQDWVGKA
ncbi:MAG TPA: Mur ligase family protein, partial [Candidatus Methylomirabilis sp.]|nr:Mur ligase family protein [Candidatus Methylomirabilis sp.]